MTPAASADRTSNELRPTTFDEIVGQERAKDLMRRAIASCFARKRPLDHTLLVAESGTGKSTFSHVIANELRGIDIYELEAPVSIDMLAQLRTTMYDGDILKIEEIHQQAIMERRGRTGATQPEVLYAVMEDRVLQSPSGVLPFPHITVIGTTTDEGLLPDAFINRFPLRPRLDPYTLEQLCAIVRANARTLELDVTPEAALVLARASRGVPREINNLVRNAMILHPPGATVTAAGALEVLNINGIAPDGLTPDMQATLIYLFTKARRVAGDGEVRYQSGVDNIATAIGKSRDSKAVKLRVEPYLIRKGLLQVAHGGRVLTEAGIARAKELL